MKEIKVTEAKMTDHDHVHFLLECSKPLNLEIECLVSALRRCRDGMTIEEACYNALKEWDCLPIEITEDLTDK